MASATATATMAAAGFDKRASVASSASLQTPGSGGFPSEMLSPMAGSPGWLKKDELKTPITPPSAYLDFLNKMSGSALMSPAPTSTSSHFSFGSRPSEKSSEAGAERPTISPPPTSQLPPLSRNTSRDSTTSQVPPLSRNMSHESSTSQIPPLSRNTSYDSNASHHSTTSTASQASSGGRRSRPQSPRVIIPPSQFVKPTAPRSARTPRLRIPQSPFSPALGSAHSVHSVPSPYSSTPLSAAPWSASYSPREAEPGKVSVRQTVTRTVTYCRTPLDPAPKGKRRKVEVEDLGSKSSSEEPPMKQEKIDEEEETTPGPPDLPSRQAPKEALKDA